MYHQKYIKYKTKYINLKNQLKINQLGGKNNSIELYQWIEFYKPKHLTINDLKKWKKGDIKDVLVLDRNFEEYFIWTELEENKDYDPKYFFKENKCRIEYNGGNTWKIHYPYGNIVCHDIEIDVESLGSNYDWCPLEDGYVILERNGKKIHWKDLDGNIRVGWRGPMIFWSYIKNEPQVFFREQTN